MIVFTRFIEFLSIEEDSIVYPRLTPCRLCCLLNLIIIVQSDIFHASWVCGVQLLHLNVFGIHFELYYYWFVKNQARGVTWGMGVTGIYKGKAG